MSAKSLRREREELIYDSERVLDVGCWMLDMLVEVSHKTHHVKM